MACVYAYRLVVIPGADAEPHMYGEELSHKAIRGFIKGMVCQGDVRRQ